MFWLVSRPLVTDPKPRWRQLCHRTAPFAYFHRDFLSEKSLAISLNAIFFFGLPIQIYDFQIVVWLPALNWSGERLDKMISEETHCADIKIVLTRVGEMVLFVICRRRDRCPIQFFILVKPPIHFIFYYKLNKVTPLFQLSFYPPVSLSWSYFICNVVWIGKDQLAGYGFEVGRRSRNNQGNILSHWNWNKKKFTPQHNTPISLVPSCHLCLGCMLMLGSCCSVGLVYSPLKV